MRRALDRVDVAEGADFTRRVRRVGRQLNWNRMDGPFISGQQLGLVSSPRAGRSQGSRPPPSHQIPRDFRFTAFRLGATADRARILFNLTCVNMLPAGSGGGEGRGYWDRKDLIFSLKLGRETYLCVNYNINIGVHS